MTTNNNPTNDQTQIMKRTNSSLELGVDELIELKADVDRLAFQFNEKPEILQAFIRKQNRRLELDGSFRALWVAFNMSSQYGVKESANKYKSMLERQYPVLLQENGQICGLQ